MDNRLHSKIVKAITVTPMLSPSVSRLLEVSAAPGHDLVEIIDIIRGDYALTAQILRISNSVIFNPIQPIASINRAVAYLGEIYVVGIALNQGAAGIFNSPLRGYEGRKRDLWRHQLYSAIEARIVSRFAKKPIEADLAFTGGLLHDIGKAILSENIRESAGEIIAGIAADRYRDYMDAEEKLFGTNHVEVGLVLAEHWRLPSLLQEIIRHHHTPAAAPPELRALIYAVHCGDALSMMAGYDTGSDGLKYHLDEGYRDYFDLSGGKLEALQIEAGNEFAKFEKSIDPGNGTHEKTNQED